MAAEGMIQLIGGEWQDSQGNPLENGFLIYKLSGDAYSPSGQVCAGIDLKVYLDATGNIPAIPAVFIWPAALLVPDDLTYDVQAYTQYGARVWKQFAIVAVTVTPHTWTMNKNTTKQFAATVTGTADQSVVWTCSAGMISDSGLYTAPNFSGMQTVTATSVVDPTKSDSAVVTVQNPSS